MLTGYSNDKAALVRRVTLEAPASCALLTVNPHHCLTAHCTRHTQADVLESLLGVYQQRQREQQQRQQQDQQGAAPTMPTGTKALLQVSGPASTR